MIEMRTWCIRLLYGASSCYRDLASPHARDGIRLAFVCFPYLLRAEFQCPFTATTPAWTRFYKHTLHDMILVAMTLAYHFFVFVPIRRGDGLDT